MRKTIVHHAVLGAAFALFAASPSLAQEAAAEPFEGFHAEGVTGLDSVSSFGLQANGLVYDIAGGYDARFDNLVAGVELEGGSSTRKFCIEFDPGEVQCQKTDYNVYAGARGGFLINPTTMFYIKGGYTNLASTVTFNGKRFPQFSGSKDGWLLGVGAEHRFETFLIKAEYRHARYGDFFDRDQVVLGVGIHF